MPREIPDCPTKPNPIVEASRKYEVELITPMFGGGVEPRVNDPGFPIRPTTIRGQLQFWWRATVGAKFATLLELRKAQSEIWGSTERASRVQVSVGNIRTSDPLPCARNDGAHRGEGPPRTTWQAPFNNSALPYVLFPFQGETRRANKQDAVVASPAACIRQAAFQVTLFCPKDLWPQVEPAVWAWANFGGLGGRTRRGCGAIRCRELAPRGVAHFGEQLKQFVPPRHEVRQWPTVGPCVMTRADDPPNDPILVWDRLVGCYRDFRQGEEFARNRGQKDNRPGRSRYPEPETIRRVTRQRSGEHARLVQIPDDAFPRAELGLPIVFHFQGRGEPEQTVLYPSHGSDGKRERMASPLILKPLALADGKAIPLILRSTAPPLIGVDLRKGDTSIPLPPTTVIRDARLSTYPNSPLGGSPNGSALDAFIALARSEKFTEVTR